MRNISRKYSDPLELIWLHAASQMGMKIARSAEVNASWDGVDTLTIGTPETLDPDDSLAQMILHEACHALVEGPECLTKPDWGLESFNPARKVHEHACLRLQAALAGQYGMRSFFASTTVFRRYYDQLPADPLADGDDPAIAMAQSAMRSLEAGPWKHPLHDALRRTSIIAGAVQDVADTGSLWKLSK